MQDRSHDFNPTQGGAASPPPPTTLPPTSAQRYSPAPAKNPWLAGLLSFFPGMGNVYNGLYLRAVTFFVLICVLMYLANETSPVFGFALAFVWIFNVLDAYRQAALINSGYAAEPDLAQMRRSQASVSEKLVAGGVLLAVGGLALLDRFFRIDLDWIVELWPVVLIAVGGWLLWSALQSRQKEKAQAYGGDSEYGDGSP